MAGRDAGRTRRAQLPRRRGAQRDLGVRAGDREGDKPRIYRTTDGGATWDAVFVNDDPAAFYDCMAFYPGGRRGLAMSDPVDGKFRILATDDFGASWRVLPSTGMPPAPRSTASAPAATAW